MMIFIREKLEDFLRNFFGEEIGGVRGTLTPQCKRYNFDTRKIKNTKEKSKR